jgi:hypothetical protein
MRKGVTMQLAVIVVFLLVVAVVMIFSVQVLDESQTTQQQISAFSQQSVVTVLEPYPDIELYENGPDIKDIFVGNFKKMKLYFEGESLSITPVVLFRNRLMLGQSIIITNSDMRPPTWGLRRDGTIILPEDEDDTSLFFSIPNLVGEIENTEVLTILFFREGCDGMQTFPWGEDPSVNEDATVYGLANVCGDYFLGLKTFTFTYSIPGLSILCQCDPPMEGNFCGTEGCAADEMFYSRNCDPPGCLEELFCVKQPPCSMDEYGCFERPNQCQCSVPEDCEDDETCNSFWCKPVFCGTEIFCNYEKKCEKTWSVQNHQCWEEQISCKCSSECGADPRCDGVEPGTNGCNNRCKKI